MIKNNSFCDNILLLCNLGKTARFEKQNCFKMQTCLSSLQTNLYIYTSKRRISYNNNLLLYNNKKHEKTRSDFANDKPHHSSRDGKIFWHDKHHAWQGRYLDSVWFQFGFVSLDNMFILPVCFSTVHYRLQNGSANKHNGTKTRIMLRWNVLHIVCLERFVWFWKIRYDPVVLLNTSDLQLSAEMHK